MEKVVAVYSNGLSGIEILDIEYGIIDRVVYRTHDGKIHKHIIYYNERPYFINNGIRIHFDECMRV